jgi:hypothetical protein
VRLIVLAILVSQLALLQSAEAQQRSDSRRRDRSGNRSAATTAPSGEQSAVSQNGSAASPAAAPAALPQTQQSYRERYGIVTERNIFLRERPRFDRNNNNNGPTTAPVRTPEQTFVLTGVVLEGGERRAYFEDRSKNSMLRVSVGDSLARGKIAEIDIDSVAYDGGNGRQTWVDVGSDLTGTYSPSVVASSSSDHPPSTSPADLGFDPNSPNLTTEQKMKLRRVQQMQGAAK